MDDQVIIAKSEDKGIFTISDIGTDFGMDISIIKLKLDDDDK